MSRSWPRDRWASSETGLSPCNRSDGPAVQASKWRGLARHRASAARHPGMALHLHQARCSDGLRRDRVRCLPQASPDCQEQDLPRSQTGRACLHLFGTGIRVIGLDGLPVEKAVAWRFRFKAEKEALYAELGGTEDPAGPILRRYGIEVVYAGSPAVAQRLIAEIVATPRRARKQSGSISRRSRSRARWRAVKTPLGG